MSDTYVVNLRLASYDVYIGRPGKGRDGPLGNPAVVGKMCPICDDVHPDAGSTLPCHRLYLWQRADDDPDFRALLLACRGKVLGCFCKNRNGEGPCHGDNIVEWLNEHVA